MFLIVKFIYNACEFEMCIASKFWCAERDFTFPLGTPLNSFETDDDLFCR